MHSAQNASQNAMTCTGHGCGQNHYVRVTQEAIFIEQNMRFGLILGRLAILKKKFGSDNEQLFKAVFHFFN